MSRLIGRIIATEKNPTTIDKFCFWTSKNEKLGAFDVVKVEHLDGSFTYGVIENISHITDSSSYLSNYISSDFGNVEVEEPTYRVGMNYAEAKVTFNDKNLYTPVHNNSAVCLATAEEIRDALGLIAADSIDTPIVCGALMMYGETDDPITLPVHLDSRYLLGIDGAHLNISGISGLASKTSYAMFLMKAIQDVYLSKSSKENSGAEDSVAFVIFNVKDRDLMAIHDINNFDGNDDERKKTMKGYENLGLLFKPFEQVQYFIPYSEPTSNKRSTYLERADIEAYGKRLFKYMYVYEDDKESIEMMFANVDDPQKTIESIITKIIDPGDSDFGAASGVGTWDDFEDKVASKSKGGDYNKGGEILTQSWKRFKRYLSSALRNDDMFTNGPDSKRNECRLGDKLKAIKANDVYVIDVAKLSEDKQAFVFGDTIRTLYNIKLGEYDDDPNVNVPSKLVIFFDELNKYASKDIPTDSPILRQIMKITAEGRSRGIILFAAEQFRSNIVDRVTGNCSNHAYGRTTSIETATKDYSSLPGTYKNLLTRLKQGDYLIQSPIFRSLLKIHFPKPVYKQFKQ